MKKSDWILAAAVLLAAGVLGAWFLLGKSEGSQVVVTIDGEAFGTYPWKKIRLLRLEMEIVWRFMTEQQI